MSRMFPLLARRLQASRSLLHGRTVAQINRDVISRDSLEKEELKKQDVKSDDMPNPELRNPFEKEKPKCILCQYDITPDYKNVKLLSQFISPYTGRVYGRHITRLCKAKQEIVEREILKSQNCGFMPYYFKQPHFFSDPKLFDANRPIRSHRF